MVTDRPDFRGVAAKARAAHEAAEAEKSAKRDAERQAREAFIAKAVAALNADVLVLLNQAQADFASEQIEAIVEPNFDVRSMHHSVLPSVSFQCLGPKRPSDGWQFKSIPVFFSSDGEFIYAGAGEHSLSTRAEANIGKAPVGQPAELVASSVQRAVESYYKELADCHWLK